jgi:hypothetical protein
VKCNACHFTCPTLIYKTLHFKVESAFDKTLNIQAKGLVLRHVLEHIQNPFDFLLQLKKANGGSGKIYIEVPCLNWICQHKAWFDIFYEHVNYFRLTDFYQMFDVVYESGHLFGDQYLYVVADLAGLKNPVRHVDDSVIFPKDFTENIQTNHSKISKGVIFSLLKERAGQIIKTVIDINPAKQGKYLAATGLRVQSPAEALQSLSKGSIIYIMNSNYLEEIKKMSNNLYHYIQVDHESF